MNNLRPFITICYTQTIDGRLATANGESQWIGGTESVAYWHQLRAEHDAIMVGIGTVVSDNPRLTVRLVPGRDPLRIVVDSTLRTPNNAAALANGALLATTEHAPAERRAMLAAHGAEILVLPSTQNNVDLNALCAALATRNIASVMVEGGARLISSLLRARLADRLVVCVAPRLMGHGTDAIGDIGVTRLADMPQLADVQIHQFGVDTVFDGRLSYPPFNPDQSDIT